MEVPTKEYGNHKVISELDMRDSKAGNRKIVGQLFLQKILHLKNVIITMIFYR